MYCRTLDALIRGLNLARRNARVQGEGLWTDDVMRCMSVVNDHRCEGHNGQTCSTTEF
jgi:hypothetical protein